MYLKLLFLDTAQNQHWFGERSEICKASRFDDILNGVDMITTVLDKQDVARHFEIATDLTMSTNGLAEKFNRIKNDVHRGKLAQIDYFHSDLIGFTGRLKDIPRTIVSLDKANVEKFLANWLREPELNQEHFALIALQQIAAQAEGFGKIAANEHGTDSLPARRYRNAYNVSQEIIESKHDIAMPEDTTLETIKAMSARAHKD